MGVLAQSGLTVPAHALRFACVGAFMLRILAFGGSTVFFSGPDHPVLVGMSLHGPCLTCHVTLPMLTTQVMGSLFFLAYLHMFCQATRYKMLLVAYAGHTPHSANHSLWSACTSAAG